MIIDLHKRPYQPLPRANARAAGFSLIELMIAVTLSLIVVAGLGTVLANLSTANRELQKINSQIENGRFAVQIMQNDLMHAGFWDMFLPQFLDTNWTSIPNDAPGSVPDPCLAYSGWDNAYKDSLIGIPVQTLDSAPGTCALTNKAANTDVMVVRHASECVAGAAGCDAITSGKVYFQASLCGDATAGTAQGGTANTITLGAPATTGASLTSNFYVGMRIRLTGGPGVGDTRTVTAYNATTNVATVDSNFSATPTAATTYTIVENILDYTSLTLRQRGANCSTATLNTYRQFVSNIYWIRDFATTSGDGIPTLVRTSFDPTAGSATRAHQSTPEVLVENIERFRVELGIDSNVTRCSNTAVSYAAVVAKIDPDTCAVSATSSDNTLPTNRGDGIPDSHVRCTTAAPCTAAQLSNAVAAKLYVLARAEATTPGHTDNKTYCMGSTDADGTCPSANKVGPFNDGYKRQLFTTTVRMTNVLVKRETP